MRKILIGAVLALCFLMISLTLVGKPLPRPTADASAPAAKAPPPDESLVLAAAVTVARVAPADFVETVLATGSLVAREEILVGPEVEGLRITEVLADEGMRVKKGDVLARLVADTLDAQLAQNDAALARATATIAQASSGIVQAEARLVESSNAFERAKPLRTAGPHGRERLRQPRAGGAHGAGPARRRPRRAHGGRGREGADRGPAPRARLAARPHRGGGTGRRHRQPPHGAHRRLCGRARRSPMFRIVANGEVELDAEVTETRMAAIRVGQPARVEITGLGTIAGTVRLVSPEVDKGTRLGRVRIFLGDNPGLRVGAFARGSIETARGRGSRCPPPPSSTGRTAASVASGARRTASRRAKIKTGLVAAALTEVREGLSEGDVVVARSGTFLRDGDAVRPVAGCRAKLSDTG